MAAQSHAVVRFQGGANAGHTLIVDGQKTVLHLIPSGVLHPHVRCMIGSGVTMDPFEMVSEITGLKKTGYLKDDQQLSISDGALLVLPFHRRLDKAREAWKSSTKIGTTGRGIGPSYEDRASRRALLFRDLFCPDLKIKLQKCLEEKNVLLEKLYGEEPADLESCYQDLVDVAKILAPYRCRDLSYQVNQMIASGKEVLFEGAQGVLLDNFHGTFPFVTSSSTGAAAACLGLIAVMALPLLSSPDQHEANIVEAADKKQSDQPISFNRDIRPILSDKCFACHGPDAAVAEGAGGFRLDIREGAIAPAAASGKQPIIPGDAANSEVIKRIKHTKPNLVMPPPSTHTTVTKDEVELLKRWIDEGAEYEGHWAYETPRKPDLPEIGEASEKWVKNNIDRFVAYRLKNAGLTPSKLADKATLIRRVTLDLTGLPPTPEEIDAFLADDSADSYEKLIDRLLASPHFGERLAVVWLDAARYGDTNGFHHDNIRTAWPWRQWVIEAFNANMPYDQFIIEQLAGDLLPNATQDQILASGFCRMHNINDEGGAINEEYLVEAHADRIETIATVMMAQTFNCARCHDHKYDPTTQEDYFSLVAYFNSVEGERGVYGNNFTAARAYPPFMLWQSEADKKRLPELEAKSKQLQDEMSKQDFNADDLTRGLLAQGNISWAGLKVKEAKASRGVQLKTQEDGSVLATGRNNNQDTYTISLNTTAKDLRVIRLDALRHDSLPHKGLGRADNGNAVLSHIQAKAISIKDPSQSRDLALVYAHADFAQDNGDFDIQNALIPDALGWAVGSHVKAGDRSAHLLTAEPFGYEGGTQLVIKLHFKSQYNKHSLGRVRIDAGALASGVVPESAAGYFAVARQAADVAHEQKMIADRAVPVLIMKEATKPRPQYILARGAYDKPIKTRIDENGTEVPVEPLKRRPPSTVDLPLPEGAPDNRLGFAQWLVQPDHPLTSRVHVNRLWQMVFGTGIVKSIEDFGSQAEWPSHPDLLDYLAVKFVETGWDQKALIKEIVMSATYRQLATRNITADEVDADNRLLSYFPRQRLKAEFIRDQALFVSGLLDDQIGGPSVVPYQPGDLWFEVAIGSSNTMLVTVVAMGYTRQAIALGLVMIGLVMLGRQ
ncbi:MAG: adenylosuccinate synthetase, partial [Planctomycetota bacterium]